MKKFVAILFAVAMVCSTALPAAVSASAADTSSLAGTTINVYNWGEYISDGSEGSMDVNAEFTKRTGIKVNYNNYDTNENMYAKLKSDGVSFDIVIPSDYMIERLIAEGMLQKIDFSNIPNYKYIDAKYKGLYFDPEDAYSVPYNVGMVGLIYNTKLVKEAPTSWSVMWDEQYKGKILMFDNPRDAFGIAQKLLGQSFNTTDEAEWKAAAEKLKEQKPVLQGYVMDDIFRKWKMARRPLRPITRATSSQCMTITPILHSFTRRKASMFSSIQSVFRKTLKTKRRQKLISTSCWIRILRWRMRITLAMPLQIRRCLPVMTMS